jgi:N-methylhydantoinase B
MDALRGYSERRMRALIAGIPDGAYAFEDVLEDDGAGARDIPIRVTVTIRGDEATVDFTGTHDQVEGNVNANEAVTLSAVLYVFLALGGPDLPASEGCFEPLRVIAPPGTVVHAVYPAAVAGGNVETSQRIVDVVLGALAQRSRTASRPPRRGRCRTSPSEATTRPACRSPTTRRSVAGWARGRTSTASTPSRRT